MTVYRVSYGVHYDDGSDADQTYRGIYYTLYHEDDTEEKGVINSGNFGVDWIDFWKFVPESCTIWVHSSSFDHFIMDSEKWTPIHFDCTGETPRLITDPREVLRSRGLLEMFRPADVTITSFEEHRAWYKEQKNLVAPPSDETTKAG